MLKEVGMKHKIGFIGLGHMGLPMAVNILKAGFPLCVYNRTKEKATPLLAKGAHFANTPSELAEISDIVVSMVANDHALEEITHKIFSSPKKPLIHISMSTVSPDLVTDLEKKHKEKGIVFLAAPVSGRPERAKEGTLWIFLAGEAHAKQTVTPILQAMSVKIFDLGENPAQSALFKLCNNFMIISLIEAFSEASTLLEKKGISPSKAAEIWGSSLFDAPVFHSYTPMICKKNFQDGGFALSLGLKDIRLLQMCADKELVPMPFLGSVQEKMLTSMNLGREEHDWSVIALLMRELAGLK
jgi:3-hydroxyisobutyrate dehydrogenase-like beta-hydroxyacid dehydrogenase